MHTNYTWDTADFVMSAAPSFPTNILITIPHNGFTRTHFDGFYQKRTEGVVMSDLFVYDSALDIARLHPVMLCRGLINRHYLDYNRRKNESYIDPTLENYYDAYFARVEKLVGDRKDIVHIDLHGFTNQPSYAPATGYDLILGTRNRKTVNSDIDSKIDLCFSKRNYDVFLPKDKPVRDIGDAFDGGYTVGWVSEKLKINSIQIEIARRFRQKESKDLGIKLAQDFADFFKQNC